MDETTSNGFVPTATAGPFLKTPCGAVSGLGFVPYDDDDVCTRQYPLFPGIYPKG